MLLYDSVLDLNLLLIEFCYEAGTEVYQEKLVEAVAHYLQASLLVLDSTVLSPHVSKLSSPSLIFVVLPL